MTFNKISVLKHNGKKWSWLGGERFVSYAGTSTAVKIQHSKISQLFDIQARNGEVCTVFLEDTFWPRVYCFRDSDGDGEAEWVELGKSNNDHRIGKMPVEGDIELLMPGCNCPEYSNAYFVIAGGTVWYYIDDGNVDGNWKPMGITSLSTSGDAHLAITGVGSKACHLHAVVSDEEKNIHFSRFSTKDKAQFESGNWEVLASIGGSVAKPGITDFVFANGIPAIAWTKSNGDSDFVYLSVWKDYPTANANARDRFKVAGALHNGAIPPFSSNENVPMYQGIQALSIDSNEDIVYIEITTSGNGNNHRGKTLGNKIYVSAIDVADPEAQWMQYSPQQNGSGNALLPHPKPHDRSGTLCQEEKQEAESGLWSVASGAHSHMKINCNGDVLLAHVAAKDHSPKSIVMLAKNGPIDHRNVCAGGRRLGGGFFGGFFGR